MTGVTTELVDAESEDEAIRSTADRPVRTCNRRDEQDRRGRDCGAQLGGWIGKEIVDVAGPRYPTGSSGVAVSS